MTGEQLKTLRSFSDDAWYYLVLQRDPFFERVEASRKPEVLEKSKERGRILAERWLQAEDSGSSIRERLESYGIAVNPLQADQRPPVVIFAAFKTKPSSIDLYMPAISLARAQLNEPGVWDDDEAPDTSSIKDLILAHEAFHYMDDQDPDGRYKERVAYKIGPFSQKATLRATDEVSAAVFAQTVAGPDYNPALLDVALLCAYQKKREDYAADFIKALQEISDTML